MGAIYWSHTRTQSSAEELGEVTVTPQIRDGRLVQVTLQTSSSLFYGFVIQILWFIHTARHWNLY